MLNVYDNCVKTIDKSQNWYKIENNNRFELIYILKFMIEVAFIVVNKFIIYILMIWI